MAKLSDNNNTEKVMDVIAVIPPSLPVALRDHGRPLTLLLTESLPFLRSSEICTHAPMNLTDSPAVVVCVVCPEGFFRC